MRLNDERALYGLADDDARADPANARTAAEFVVLLGALVEQSGLSLAEIEEVARSKGYVLPEQLVATVLSNDALPPEEMVVALVRSIGINDREVKYWVEALWRLESRTPHNPARDDQEHERKAPRDIEQIYGPKDERGPSAPYRVSAASEAVQRPVPGIDPYLDRPGDAGYAAPMAHEVGQVPDEDEPYDVPRHHGAAQGPAVGEAYEAESYPGEPPYVAAAGYGAVEYDEPRVGAAPVSPAASRGYSEESGAHAVQERGKRSARTGMHRLSPRDDEGDDGGHRDDDLFLMQRHETGEADRKARWPLPVAVGLSVMLAASVVAWMAIGGGGGEAPSDTAGPPPASTRNQTSTGGVVTGGSVSPTTGEGSLPTGEGVPPGTEGNPPANPDNANNPNPNPQPTTQGPQPAPTQPGTYNTQLNGTGSTTCTAEGGQWRVRILVNLSVSDPPPGLVPQGQAGLPGALQGFSFSGGGSSYSGSRTVSVGPSSSPNVGTVQWVVTLAVPGGRTARDESFEGYSCA